MICAWCSLLGGERDNNGRTGRLLEKFRAETDKHATHNSGLHAREEYIDNLTFMTKKRLGNTHKHAKLFRSQEEDGRSCASEYSQVSDTSSIETVDHGF